MSNRISVRDVEHLIRPIGLALVLLLVFLGVRAFMVPADFGEYGHYRGGAITDAREQKLEFAGRDACTPCHENSVASRTGSAHENIGCESCHGALATHAEDPGALIPELPDPESLCLRCHEYSAYRPGAFPQVIAEDHTMGESCASCHEPHSPGLE